MLATTRAFARSGESLRPIEKVAGRGLPALSHILTTREATREESRPPDRRTP
jgi:hypothetical protein